MQCPKLGSHFGTPEYEVPQNDHHEKGPHFESNPWCTCMGIYTMTVRGGVGGGDFIRMCGVLPLVCLGSRVWALETKLPLGVQCLHLSMTGDAPRDPQRAYPDLGHIPQLNHIAKM